MNELTILLGVLFVVLAVVTLVGHGIWVLLSNLFGGPRSPAAPAGSPAAPHACPRCLMPLNLMSSNCGVCGWPKSVGSAADNRAAIRAVREQVERLARSAAIDAATRGKLTAVLAEEEQRLIAAQLASAKAEREAREASTRIPVPMKAGFEALPPADVPPTAGGPVPAAAASHLSVTERAHLYAASRAAAAEDLATAEPAAPPPPPKHREAFSSLLAAFMEEKNIRWGELVGGLLIVGCSMALVISFWSEIAERPLLKFGLFNGVTAALFGVGLYTDRRWEIHTTSRGVLLTALLLVPLNFLVIAAFTQGASPSDWLPLAGEAASLVVFAWLVLLAGRVLAPDMAWLLATGVMVPAIVQLVGGRFASAETSIVGVYALAAVPLATYLTTSIVAAQRLWAKPDLEEPEANRLLMFLGEVTASTAAPLGLLAYLVPPLQQTLHRLSPLVLLAGLPALVVGLLFWRRMSDRRLSSLQTTGIVLGALGAFVMLGAVLLAWPEPITLLPTALLAAVTLAATALWFGIPAALLPAALALAAAWLMGFHLARGSFEWTQASSKAVVDELLSAVSGHALVPLVALLGGVAAWLRRIGRREDAVMLALAAAGVAAASLALLVKFGWGLPDDPKQITWTLALYAVAAIVAAIRFDRLEIAWVAMGLLLATLVQGIVYRYAPGWQLERPWIAALLAYATIATIGTGLIITLRSHAVKLYQSLHISAWVTSVIAAVLIAAMVWQGSCSNGAASLYLAWLGVVWLAMAILSNSPETFAVAQVALLLALFAAVAAAVENHWWYADSVRPWLDPRFLEAQGIALAAYCVVIGCLRRFLTGSAARQAAANSELVLEQPAPQWSTAGQRLLNPPWPAVDRVVEIVLVILVSALSIYAVVPGAAQELAPLETARGPGPAVRIEPEIERYELTGVPHAPASDRGGWALVGAVAVALVTRPWERRGDWRLLGLVIAAAAACLLLAARWELEVAVASALRWMSAGFFAIASIPIWFRTRWTAAGLTTAGMGDANGSDALAKPAAQAVRDLLVVLVVLVYVAMGAYVTQAALRLAGAAGGFAWHSPNLLLWAGVAGVVGLVAIALPGLASIPRHAAENGSAAERRWAIHARDVLLLLAVAPLAIWLTFAVARALDQHPIVGPNVDSWFRRIGWDVSYGVPLVMIALVFIGYAIRDRSSQFAFAAGLLFNVVATIVVLLRMARGGGSLDWAAWITVAQTNAIVSGVVALVWLAAVEWWWGQEGASRGDSQSRLGETRPHEPALLVTQVALAVAVCATFLLPAIVLLSIDFWPGGLTVPTWVETAGNAAGWSAVTLAAAAAVWLNWRRAVHQLGVAVFVAGLVALIALTIAPGQVGGLKPAFHALLVGCYAAAWLLPPATHFINRIVAGLSSVSGNNAWSALPSRIFAAATVWLAVWEYSSVPSWWAIAALAAIAVRNLWIAFHEARPGFVWIAAVLSNLAVSLWWVEWGYKLVVGGGSWRSGADGFEFLWVNVLAVAVVAVLSVWIIRRTIGKLTVPQADSTALAGFAPVASRWWRGVAFHRFAAWLIVATLALTTGIGLLNDWWGHPIPATAPLAWAAWFAAFVTAVACWWDPTVRWPVACLYCVGLLAVGQYLDGLIFDAPIMFHWALGNALAAYSLVTSSLWNRRAGIRGALARWGGLSETIATESRRDSAMWEGSGHGWLVSANFIVGLGVLLLVTLVQLTLDSFPQRMVAAYAIGAQALALGFLAHGTVRTPLQYSALVFGVLFAVAFGWAWLPPSIEAPWLHRLVVTVVALVVMIVLYGFGLVKLIQRENEWTRAAARLVPLLAVLAAALFVAVLGIEVAMYLERGAVPIAWPALIAVALALVGLIAAAFAAALLPGRDPLGLSERGRTVYVYAAEALLALLFLHIRVTMPELFSGWFARFWPLVVMGIAFVGVGLGELFQRRRQNVLSGPLQTTGVLLPLLPVLGFWLQESEVHYSLLLLSIGALYAVLAVLRKSFLFGILAALSANGSLWYLLFRQGGLGLLEHPQLWLVPPALCALAAGYLNRERLSAEQSATLRYVSAIVIYVSSTADIFINGVADAPWLPAVLAGLSILGVFAGILLRVRVFLYLGTAFLLVALMTVIWYAAVEQERTYILWVAGIVTGVAIIALFGLFEKRRDDVLKVVEQLKHWQA